jgi:hypothetical protein
MWVYSQHQGILTHQNRYNKAGQIDGHHEFVEKGYSGIGPGKNNGSMEKEHDIGPIPRGMYRIHRPHDGVTEFALPLKPVGHQAHGRSPDDSPLEIHGDYLDPKKKGNASKGCIILSPETRKRIWESKDHLLYVAP